MAENVPSIKFFLKKPIEDDNSFPCQSPIPADHPLQSKPYMRLGSFVYIYIYALNTYLLFRSDSCDHTYSSKVTEISYYCKVIYPADSRGTL